MKLWAGRFQKETDTLVNDFNSSIQFDARLYKQDIAGSIAHAQMLGKQGIIEEHEVEQIVEGLKAILADIEADKVEFSVHFARASTIYWGPRQSPAKRVCRGNPRDSSTCGAFLIRFRLSGSRGSSDKLGIRS